MVSSSLGRGGDALARPAIQIGPATRAEPATISPAQRKRIDCQRELLPNRRADIHPRQGLRQRVHAGIVLELRIRREHHLDRLYHRPDEFGQTPAAGGPYLAFERPVPEKTVLAGALEGSSHSERAVKRNLEPLEQRIGGSEFAPRLDRAMAELANVNL